MGIPEYIHLGEEDVFLRELAQKYDEGFKSASESYCLRRKEYGNITKIAIKVNGGLGDYIVAMPILDSIVAYGECFIDFYTDNNIEFPIKMYGRLNVSVKSYASFRNEDYDYVLVAGHFITRKYCDCYPHISKFMPEFIRNIFYVERFNSLYYSDSTRESWRNAVTLKQAKFKGLNRWTYLSPGNDTFGMKEQRAGIMFNSGLYKKYMKSKLSSMKYIVLSRGADPENGGVNQTKVWPKERYEEFIALFKKKYPSILMIQVAADKETSLKGTDDVIRDADLDDLKIILKHAVAFVGSEGGMVHLASQMSTPCAVVFGPTPAYYYGYTRNKNIVSPYCSDCMGAIQSWYTQCLLGHERAECMMAVTGEMVLDAVDEILSERIFAYFEDDNTASGIDVMLEDESTVGFIGKDFVNESMRVAKDCAKTITISPDYLEEDDVGSTNGSCGKKGEMLKMMSHNRTMRLLKENGVTPLIANCFNIPKDDGYFDILVANLDIQSAPYAEYAMKELLRTLKPGGKLLLCSEGKTMATLRKVQSAE